MIKIDLINGSTDSEAWTDYVIKHEGSTLYHSLQWRDQLVREYGFKPFYLMAQENNKIVGVLPLFFINNLTGKKLMSLPFSMYGGALYDDHVVYEALLEKLKSIVSDLDVKKFSVESSVDLDKKWYYCNPSVVDSRIEFSSYQFNFENYFSSLDSKVKYELRKAQKCDFKVDTKNGSSDIDGFYNLLLNSRRILGLPTPRKRYIESLMQNFDGILIEVQSESSTVSGALLLRYNHVLYHVYAATDENFRRTNPGYLVYSKMMELACHPTVKELCLGGSPHQSLLAFKEKWKVTTKQWYTVELGEKGYRGKQSSGIPYFSLVPTVFLGPVNYCLLRYLY